MQITRRNDAFFVCLFFPFMAYDHWKIAILSIIYEIEDAYSLSVSKNQKPCQKCSGEHLISLPRSESLGMAISITLVVAGLFTFFDAIVFTFIVTSTVAVIPAAVSADKETADAATYSNEE